MKLLLDESVDRDIAAYFPDRFEIKTVTEMGWSGPIREEMGNCLELHLMLVSRPLLPLTKILNFNRTWISCQLQSSFCQHRAA